MKHIVIDARESGTSTGRYIDKLVEHLHELLPEAQPNYRITLLAKPHRLDFYQQIAPNFTTEPCPHREFSFDEQIGLKQQLESLRPDLVFFPAVQQPFFYNGITVTAMLDLTTVRFNNPSKNPVVFTLKQQVYAYLNKAVARKSSQIITISNYVKQDVADYCNISPTKIITTYPAADPLPGPAEPVANLSGATPFIMYVGRPMPHKNLERLIQAFTLLKQSHPDLRLVLAGKKDANYERIENLTQEQGIADILFTGFVSDQQLRWLYEHCQAYIFPSLSEGFGLPGLEAMLHGAPVVSSDATCLPEIYGDAAHYFDPLNEADMSMKIAAVLDNNSLRRKLIVAGKKKAGTYSWKRMAKQTLEVFTAALS